MYTFAFTIHQTQRRSFMFHKKYYEQTDHKGNSFALLKRFCRNPNFIRSHSASKPS